MKISTRIAIVLLLVLASLPVLAWESTRQWTSDTVTIRLDANDFPSGSAWRSAVTKAVNLWNDNPSKFQWDLRYDDTSTGTSNDQNEIWIASSYSGSAPARTLRRYRTSSGNLVETDIIFYTDEGVDWKTNSSPLSDFTRYGGTERFVISTALHELGHALGLNHENDEYNIMGTSFETLNVNDDSVRAFPGEDACAGAVGIYGLDSTDRYEVSVVHWKYDNADGAYSDHKFTTIGCASGTTCGTTSEIVVDNGDDDGDGDYSEGDWKRFHVKRGSTYSVEFTYENSGSGTHNPRVKFYLSRDGEIETSDYNIATHRIASLSRGNALTTSFDVTIPSDAALGDRYLGVIIDPNDSINEQLEDNNATYLLIEIVD